MICVYWHWEDRGFVAVNLGESAGIADSEEQGLHGSARQIMNRGAT